MQNTSTAVTFGTYEFGVTATIHNNVTTRTRHFENADYANAKVAAFDWAMSLAAEYDAKAVR